MKQPFAYFGGKANLADRIVALMPPHRVYIEPFFGSGAVFFAKAPSVYEIVNDADGAIINFFRVLRDRPTDLEMACALSPYARAEWQACEDVDDPDLDEVERARRLWVRINQAFAKRLDRTGWSITTARTYTPSPPTTVISRLGRFRDAAVRLIGAYIECCDGVDLVDRLATSDSLVYVDPTYVWSTRRNGEYRGRLRQADYRHEMDDAAHRQLAEVLRSTAAAVVLSGYPSPLYDEVYGDWWSVDFAVAVHTGNAVAGATRARRVERIWCNFEPNEGRLFDDADPLSFFGQDRNATDVTTSVGGG